MESPWSFQPLDLRSREGWRRWWPEVALLLVALLWRVLWLGMKPPHFDEGVNGYFVDSMTRLGFYHYDPKNFHGPLHFYILFFFQTLFGRHIWALRLPVALISTGCVGMMLAYRRFLGPRTCRLAALCLALSPALIFFGRYAIHESLLVFSLMLTVWGLLGLWRDGTTGDLWATALGLTGMIVTKETYAIHVIALLLAAGAMWLLERFSPSAPEPRAARQLWGEADAKRVVAVCLGLIVFFYTGCFLDWSGWSSDFKESSGLCGMVTTFLTWAHTGMATENGQGKGWYYWLQLMAEYEWPALAGLVACGWLAWPGRSRSLRYVALTGLASVCAYSIIRYKTPWCIMVLLWPLYLVLGNLAEHVATRWRPWAPTLLLVPLLGHSTLQAFRLNFIHFADEAPHPLLWKTFFKKSAESYVYVQTTQALEKIMAPLKAKVAADPANYQLRGQVLLEGEGDTHPLPWLLNDFPHVEFLSGQSHAGPSEEMNSDFLLIEDAYVGDVEDRLEEPYFRESFTFRGNSGQTLYLYFKAAVFADVLPGREPEFKPALKTGLHQEPPVNPREAGDEPTDRELPVP